MWDSGGGTLHTRADRVRRRTGGDRAAARHRAAQGGARCAGAGAAGAHAAGGVFAAQRDIDKARSIPGRRGRCTVLRARSGQVRSTDSGASPRCGQFSRFSPFQVYRLLARDAPCRCNCNSVSREERFGRRVAAQRGERFSRRLPSPACHSPVGLPILAAAIPAGKTPASSRRAPAS